ncbi:MAG: serine O-acetyltransferase [Coriobacteriaceae bacterium]|uniref:serine O-acetyltransferase EpsC n=1 Tax=Tractidigestivibacter sp. TaxID=2847320 RepID=UPI002A7F3017|nr:serine O-acetyltransferase EpsC [Tractidigestivibacter sp.]MCI6548458.1 serine O-acetyltransferase [Coriobacteriaceae bacterium]MCI6843710.1 serine O-acetyltransferase [Coriobacteriaceae bacterium]MDD7583376.1 serine O-acetyltransferase [Coriobacteriaceae bacterium]MDY4533633.1 serine O-acetyltransferase EpsC [Tractidigestivibacter sp.]
MSARLAARAAGVASASDMRTVDEMPLFEVMREDARAALERDPAANSIWDIVLYSTGTHIVWAHRRHHWLYTHGMRGLALLLAKRTRRRLGADIFPSAQIGRRFTIDHGIGVVIGATSIIGDDCLVYQGVTFGMTGKHGGKRHPTLGNNVMVGAGAIVLGDITVGDNAKVAAGSVVVHDVPCDVTVAGVPAKVVRDRRFSGPHLVEDDFDPSELDDENIRWSCTL